MTETELIPGIHCPECGENDWRVLETRQGKSRIERRRECKCGNLIVTHEMFLRKVERRTTTGSEISGNAPERM